MDELKEKMVETDETENIVELHHDVNVDYVGLVHCNGSYGGSYGLEQEKQRT